MKDTKDAHGRRGEGVRFCGIAPNRRPCLPCSTKMEG